MKCEELGSIDCWDTVLPVWWGERNTQSDPKQDIVPSRFLGSPWRAGIPPASMPVEDDL